MNKECIELYKKEQARQQNIYNNKVFKEAESAAKESVLYRETMDKIEKGRRVEEIKRNAPTKIREALLYSFLNNIYEGVLKESDTNDHNNLRYHLITEFIKENGGATKILNKMKTTSMYLSEVTFQVNKHTQKILEKFNDSDDSVMIDIKITNKECDDFLASLDKMTTEKAIKEISDRVQQALADMMVQNQKDKEQIEEIISKTQEKIDSTVKESLIQCYNRDCSQKIDKVKNSRYKSLLEVMVNAIAKHTYTSEEMKNVYLNESGKLNFDVIIETATVMYASFVINESLKLVEVNEQYIKKVYDELK